MGCKRIEIDLKQVEALAAQGMTDEQIALCLGICRKTLCNRKRENSQFTRAIEKGKARGIQSISNVIWDLAHGRIRTDDREPGTKPQFRYERPDVGAAIWFEKTRAGRTDRLDLTSGGKPMPPIQIVFGEAQKSDNGDGNA